MTGNLATNGTSYGFSSLEWFQPQLQEGSTSWYVQVRMISFHYYCVFFVCFNQVHYVCQWPQHDNKLISSEHHTEPASTTRIHYSKGNTDGRPEITTIGYPMMYLLDFAMKRYVAFPVYRLIEDTLPSTEEFFATVKPLQSSKFLRWALVGSWN